MRVEQNGDILSFFPEADMVASRIGEMRNYFVVQLENAMNVKTLILDVDGVNIIDSLGVNLVIGLYREAKAHSRSFSIRNAGPAFMKVSNFFRFPALFEVNGIMTGCLTFLLRNLLDILQRLNLICLKWSGLAARLILIL
jgi:anti-anti-sigma regulatory factor